MQHTAYECCAHTAHAPALQLHVLYAESHSSYALLMGRTYSHISAVSACAVLLTAGSWCRASYTAMRSSMMVTGHQMQCVQQAPHDTALHA
jgi:hypothetical protein